MKEILSDLDDDDGDRHETFQSSWVIKITATLHPG